MKILLISHFFPPTHIAGAEKRAFGYARNLIERGHEVQVFCAGDMETGDTYWNGYRDEEYDGIPVRRIFFNWALAPDPNRYLYDNPVIRNFLSGWLAELQPDLTHIVSCYSLSASVIAAVKQKNIPLVLTLTDFWFICPRVILMRGDDALCDGHTTDDECLRCMLWDARSYRLLNKLLPESMAASAITAISKNKHLNRIRGFRGMAINMRQRREVLTHALSNVDIILAPSSHLGMVHRDVLEALTVEVLHSGNEVGWAANLPPQSTAEAIRFGYVGQIAYLKGVHTLIAAYGALDENGPSSVLNIYGNNEKEPDYHAQLLQMVEQIGKRVNFMGEFSYEQIAEVFTEIDILIVPSLWHENNPRVIQEAFASKTPVIASDVGGITEFVHHDVSGLLFHCGDVHDLASQMQRILDEPELLKRLADSIKTVRSMEQEMDELEMIYRKLVRS